MENKGRWWLVLRPVASLHDGRLMAKLGDRVSDAWLARAAKMRTTPVSVRLTKAPWLDFI